jgi:DNA repair protein RecO
MENIKILIKCVILSRKNFGEGHVLLTLLTERYGVVKAFAFGGQRLSKRFKGNLDYFKFLEAELEQKNDNGNTTFTIAAVKNVMHDFKALSLNIQKFAAASYIQEMCSIVLTPNEPAGKSDSNYFLDLYNALCKLEKTGSAEEILSIIYEFSINLYVETGFLPEIKRMAGIKNMMSHLEEFNSRILGAAPKSFSVMENAFKAI